MFPFLYLLFQIDLNIQSLGQPSDSDPFLTKELEPTKRLHCVARHDTQSLDEWGWRLSKKHLRTWEMTGMGDLLNEWKS